MSAATSGCGAIADGDGRTPGDDLGRFRVEASLEDSDCGAQALAAPADWHFDIQLSRDEDLLYWNQGGSAVEGTLGTDGRSFRFESTTTVDVAMESDESEACTMLRRDRASGKLDDAGLDVRRFSGKLTYTFDSSARGTCSHLVGVPSGFARLPCAMRYAIEARRNLAPSERYP